MKHLDFLLKTLADLTLPVEYWDVRIEDTIETVINMVDGDIVTCTANPSLGAFVRVRKEGFWLYQSTTDLARIRSVLTTLSAQKVRARPQMKKFTAQKQAPHIAMLATQKRFSDVPLAERLQLVGRYDQVVASSRRAVSRRMRYQDVYKVKSYLNSAGTQFEFDFNQGGVQAYYILKDGENLFEDFVMFYGSDFSQLQNHDDEIVASVRESEKFLAAPPIKPGKYRVILDPETTGIFTHESFGHKSEADFMLGNAEAMETWKLGKKIAADCLSIVDHGLEMGSSGYVPIDDDGTPAQKNYLIRGGVLTGRLHSRDTAFQLDEDPTGNSRAMSFEFEPIVRMTSTYIEPGTESIDSILARSEGSVYIEGAKHGTGMSTFTIAPTRGYLIGKNGERERVKLTVISGSVFETLKNVETVSAEFSLRNKALGGCGKFDQWPLPVAYGGPFIVISEMQVS